jgi:hypothetical protein
MATKPNRLPHPVAVLVQPAGPHEAAIGVAQLFKDVPGNGAIELDPQIEHPPEISVQVNVQLVGIDKADFSRKARGGHRWTPLELISHRNAFQSSDGNAQETGFILQDLILGVIRLNGRTLLLWIDLGGWVRAHPSLFGLLGGEGMVGLRFLREVQDDVLRTKSMYYSLVSCSRSFFGC